jgi:hypothetical protein
LTNFHETYREHDVAKASPARTFGLLIGALLLLLALKSRATGGRAWPWLLGAGTALVILAAVRPAWLSPLNRGWMAFARLMNRVASPIVLAVLFLGVVWPIGLLMRLTGSDPLRLRRTGEEASYWLARDPLTADHFTRQF